MNKVLIGVVAAVMFLATGCGGDETAFDPTGRGYAVTGSDPGMPPDPTWQLPSPDPDDPPDQPVDPGPIDPNPPLLPVEPVCGDGKCDSGDEDCQNCSVDCGKCCGNGKCDPWESSRYCPADCGPSCPNGVCDTWESCLDCAKDCGACPSSPTCGNGVIDNLEQCDGSSLGGETCKTLGFDGGTLYCGHPDFGKGCTFATFGCWCYECDPGVYCAKKTSKIFYSCYAFVNSSNCRGYCPKSPYNWFNN